MKILKIILINLVIMLLNTLRDLITCKDKNFSFKNALVVFVIGMVGFILGVSVTLLAVYLEIDGNSNHLLMEKLIY